MVQASDRRTERIYPDPVAICDRIDRLKKELRLANRLLRVTIAAVMLDRSGSVSNTASPHRGTRMEASNVPA